MTKQHVAINRDYWNDQAADWVAAGERLWALDTPEWGNWNLSEVELRLLPQNMSGIDAIELGCGTGYVSAWMARRGANVRGVDISNQQLATARRLAASHGLEIAFTEGNAEALELPSDSFDFAISEYGAAIWCDPDVWLREAWRLLRTGGELVFLGNHPLTIVCSDEKGTPCDFTLHRSYKSLTGADWTEVEIDPGGVEFNRSFSGWLKLFREVGFTVLEYKELFAPETADGTRGSVPADWAKRYPAEQVWHVSKVG